MKVIMEKMSEKNKLKLFRIKCRSKRGDYVSEEEHAFCREMFKKYRAEYGNDEKEIFENTKPFGSTK